MKKKNLLRLLPIVALSIGFVIMYLKLSGILQYEHKNYFIIAILLLYALLLGGKLSQQYQSTEARDKSYASTLLLTLTYTVILVVCIVVFFEFCFKM